MRKTESFFILLGCISFFLIAHPAFAHVIVTPKQVGIAQTQVFDMSVPTEKDTPTVAIKLLIPKGVQDVIPNTKQGWTITVVKQEDVVTEIDWTNGSIPPDQRDDFYFELQVPPTPGTLAWKAYQTYQDGTVVAWDHMPTSNPEDDSAPPPYSTTKVVNDLVATQRTNTSNLSASLLISLLALVISSVSLAIVIRRK